MCGKSNKESKKRKTKMINEFAELGKCIDRTRIGTYFRYSSLQARSPEFVARIIIIDASLRHLLSEDGINCTFYSNRITETWPNLIADSQMFMHKILLPVAFSFIVSNSLFFLFQTLFPLYFYFSLCVYFLLLFDMPHNSVCEHLMFATILLSHLQNSTV